MPAFRLGNGSGHTPPDTAKLYATAVCCSPHRHPSCQHSRREGLCSGGELRRGGCLQQASHRRHDKDLTTDRKPPGSTCQRKLVNLLCKLHLAFPLMWDKQPKGKTTCTECQFRGGWRSRTALAFCKAVPGTRWHRQHPQTRARPPYLHHADKPSVREPAQAAASTRSLAPAPRPAEAQLPSRTESGTTTTRQRPRPTRPLPPRAAPLWPGPSRHAPLAACPLSPPAAPRPAPPGLAGGWGAAAEARAAGSHREHRGPPPPPCPRCHRACTSRWRQAAGRGRPRRLPAVADPVSAQRFLSIPLSALNGLGCPLLTAFL